MASTLVASSYVTTEEQETIYIESTLVAADTPGTGSVSVIATLRNNGVQEKIS